MNVIAHDHIAVQIQSFLFSGIGQVFKNEITVDFPCEDISPANDLKSQKIGYFLVPNLIRFTHKFKLKSEYANCKFVGYEGVVANYA
jgi:hypothetical protein